MTEADVKRVAERAREELERCRESARSGVPSPTEWWAEVSLRLTEEVEGMLNGDRAIKEAKAEATKERMAADACQKAVALLENELRTAQLDLKRLRETHLSIVLGDQR